MSWLNSIAAKLDSAILAISPERGARRIATRRMFEHNDRIYNTYLEGAKNDRTREDRWLGSKLSPNSGLEEDMDTNRKRSAELFRTDPIGGAVDDRTNHIVGTGFRLQAKIGGTGEENRPVNREIEKQFRRWERKCGVDGRTSFWEILRQVARSDGYHGEAFVLMSDVGSSWRKIPLALEAIDAERVSTPPEKVNDPLCRLGVQHKPNKEIEGYWIQDSTPGDTIETSYAWTFYPASRVLHYYDPWFAGQLRGLPWMTRALNKIKDSKDLDEATILAAQIEACYAVFITTASGPLGAAQGAGNGRVTAAGMREQDINPGTIKYLNQGETVSTGSPSRPGSTFAPFQEHNHRRIAAALNYSYEMLTKNWSGTSFAGGRLALTNTRLDFSIHQTRLDEQILQPIYYRVLDELVILDLVEIDSRAYADDPEDFQEHNWIAPAWPYSITPGEEINADIDAVRANIKSLAEVIASRGGDPDEVAEARKAEVAREKEYKTTPPDVLKAQPVKPAPQDVGVAA